MEYRQILQSSRTGHSTAPQDIQFTPPPLISRASAGHPVIPSLLFPSLSLSLTAETLDIHCVGLSPLPACISFPSPLATPPRVTYDQITPAQFYPLAFLPYNPPSCFTFAFSPPPIYGPASPFSPPPNHAFADSPSCFNFVSLTLATLCYLLHCDHPKPPEIRRRGADQG